MNNAAYTLLHTAGVLAYVGHRPIDDCPYDPDHTSEAYGSWCEGWRAAWREDWDEGGGSELEAV